MPVLEIKVSIDTSKNEEREAFQQFLTDLGKSGEPVIPAEGQLRKEEPTKAKEEPTKAKEEPTKAKEEPTKAKEEPTKAKEEPTKAKEGPSISVDDIRQLVASKAKKHGKELKAKLSSLGGAKNVSTLEEQYYEEFYQFAQELD